MYHSLKLLGSRYAFTCCRTLLANRRDTVFHPPYKVFSRVFLFIKASMKLVGRMHHHKYNGMDFACMECILHSYFFFPPLYYLRPIFLDIDRLYIFYKISFFLVRVTELRGISWRHLNFFFKFFTPCEFHPLNQSENYFKSWRKIQRVIDIFSYCCESNYWHTVGLVRARLPPQHHLEIPV